MPTPAFPVLFSSVGMVLPYNAKLGMIGDSIAGQWIYSLSNDQAYCYENGYPTWADAWTGGLYSVPVGACKGYPGETAVAILTDARIDALIATGIQAVIIEPGINDIVAGSSAATILAARAYGAARFRAAGILVFNATITGTYAPNALTAPQEAVRLAVNAGIKAQATYGVYTVDTAAFVTSSAQFHDGLHPNALGAYDFGKGISPVLAAHIRSGDPLGLFASQPAYVVNFPLAGTSGSLTGGATGVVATSHTLAAGSAGGATVVGSKASDGKQVITLSGSYTGSGRVVQFFNSTSSGTLPGALETLESMLVVEVLSNPSSIACVTVNSQIFTAGFALSLGRSGTSESAGTALVYPMMSTDGPRVFRGAQATLLAGTPAIVSNFVNIRLVDVGVSTPVSLSVKINAFGTFKSP